MLRRARDTQVTHLFPERETRSELKSPWPEPLDAELLFHRSAEAVFHLRALIVCGRGSLVVGLGLYAQPNEIRAGRSDDLRHLAVKVVEIVDGDGALEARAAGHRGVVGAVLIDYRHVFDGLIALIVDHEMLHVARLL